MTLQQASKWIAWGLASFFYAYQYILRVIPRILMPDIMNKFEVDASLYGQFSGFYYLGYVFMHLPLGFYLDRVGPKIIMPICIILTIVGMLPLIYTDLWIYPCLGRVLIGMGSSGAILGVFKIIRLNFHEDHFTRMLGLSVMIGLIGAIYGGWPIHMLQKYFTWDHLILLLIFVGLGLATILYILVPRLNASKQVSKKPIASDIKAIFANKRLILICVLGGLMVGPLEGFADVWGTAFLKQVYGFDAALAAGLPDFIFFGMCFGSPFLSYLADKTKAYYLLILLSAFGMGIIFIFVLLGWGTVHSLSILFWVVGVLCAYQILVIYKATTCVNFNLVGLSTASANMVIMSFGYVFHSLIGKGLTFFSGTTLKEDIGSYGSDAFILSLSLIPLGLFIGGVGFLWLFLSEKRKKAL